MGKKLKNAGKGSAPTAEAPPPKEVTYQLTSADVLQKLVRSLKSYDKQRDEIVASSREKLAYAVEKQHLHKGVFAVARRLDKMEPEQLALWLATFDHYVEALGIRQRAESAPGLDLGDEPGAEGQAEEASNVRQLRANGTAAAEIG